MATDNRYSLRSLARAALPPPAQGGAAASETPRTLIRSIAHALVDEHPTQFIPSPFLPRPASAVSLAMRERPAREGRDVDCDSGDDDGDHHAYVENYEEFWGPEILAAIAEAERYLAERGILPDDKLGFASWEELLDAALRIAEGSARQISADM